AANRLERESLAAQFGDDRDLDDLRLVVDAPVAFVSRRDHFAFVPPLELAQSDAGQLRDLVGGEDALRFFRRADSAAIQSVAAERVERSGFWRTHFMTRFFGFNLNGASICFNANPCQRF